jgi:hypothetical protein
MDPFHIVFNTDEISMTIMSMEDTPWDDGHHRSTLFRLLLLHFLLFLKQKMMFCMKGNWVTFHLPSLLIFRFNPESWNIFTSVAHVFLKRSVFTELFSKNFVTFLLGVTKKFLELIQILLYMRLRLTWTLKTFDKDFS